MEVEKAISKIFFVGSIYGQFSKLFQTVENIDRTHGPFELMLCPGRIFGENNQEFYKILSGELKCPIPLFVLGPMNGQDLELYGNVQNVTSGGIIAPNIYCLGSNGVYRTNSGITIAFISFSHFSDNIWGISTDHNNIIFDYLSKTLEFKGVDIFVSPLWPSGILTRLNTNSQPVPWQANVYFNDSNKPDAFIAKLASLLKPRYHVTTTYGDLPFFYQRPPFRVYNGEEGGHYSSFISLAPFNNDKEEKGLFSLKISSIKFMDYAELCKEVEGATHNPLPRLSLNEVLSKISTHNQSPLTHHEEVQISVTGQQQCWFCLENPHVQKHLIFFIANYNYLSLAKGGLVPDHLLLCSKSHVNCAAALDSETYKEMNRLKKLVRKMFSSQNKSVVMFERNYHCQHFQLQIVPLNGKQNPLYLSNIFIRFGKKYNMDFNEIPSNQKLADVVPLNAPYFYIEFDDGVRLLHLIHGKIPIHFGREVLASHDVLSLHPDRIDWKNCEQTSYQETNKSHELGEKFKQYI